jgi:hypothetical protein
MPSHPLQARSIESRYKRKGKKGKKKRKRKGRTKPEAIPGPYRGGLPGLGKRR